MKDLVTLALLTSCFIVGIKLITAQGMLFEEIGRRLELLSQKPHLYKIMQPLWSCVYCMASVYGAASYLIFHSVSIKTIYELPLFMIILVPLNGIIFNLSNFKEDD
jgi:hypothetical protein